MSDEPVSERRTLVVGLLNTIGLSLIPASGSGAATNGITLTSTTSFDRFRNIARHE
jgi:hypothetical protein